MYDIAIIGAGPAGASAALFTSKAGKKTIMFDSGSSATKRALLKNHYGVLEITGPELVETGIRQAEELGTTVQSEKVVSIQKGEDGFHIETEASSYESKYIILATGLLTEIGEKLGVETKPGTEPRIKKIFVTDEKGKTNVENVWACGTVAGVSMHTIITAGDGARVGINLISEMDGKRYVDHDVL
ncbi:FAD-dependent oxidoreductase [Fervidibacillus halotolerans]|uniref:FAD-dependent oxidoreductase n=1 Tax=Fervidibacillus halotolerans TaxID=2980027 RepID=A0A9E8LY59_9BACI|nr:FAD-dependent oxidoreductase [Fervidibacillus halotolerans]WAA11572.1 FAD-dependent oxidoreductase [Fervidibacillus halotolerans]